MAELYQDYQVYVKEHELEEFPKIKKMLHLLLKTTFPIVLFFRLSTHRSLFVRLISIPCYKFARLLSGVQIPRGTRIGKGLFLPHFGMIVINKKARFGDYLTLYHGVTVGAKGAASDDIAIPKVADNVRISTGAIILGGIEIGNNATIGAGAVVTRSIQEDKIVVGNPAKPIN